MAKVARKAQARNFVNKPTCFNVDTKIE